MCASAELDTTMCLNKPEPYNILTTWSKVLWFRRQLYLQKYTNRSGFHSNPLNCGSFHSLCCLVNREVKFSNQTVSNVTTRVRTAVFWHWRQPSVVFVLSMIRCLKSAHTSTVADVSILLSSPILNFCSSQLRI